MNLNLLQLNINSVTIKNLKSIAVTGGSIVQTKGLFPTAKATYKDTKIDDISLS